MQYPTTGRSVTTDQTAPTAIKREAPVFPERIALKAIKIHHGLSEETYAYTASVYLDGKRVGSVKNDGRGGPDMLDVADRKAREAVEAIQREYFPGDYGEDVLFGEMLNEHLLQQEVAKSWKKWRYRFAVLAGDAMYGFNDPANIEPAMAEDGHAEYRVFTRPEAASS